jgi:hypothetical protein
MRLESRVDTPLVPDLPLMARPAATLATLAAAPRAVCIALSVEVEEALMSHAEFAHGKVDPVEAGKKGGATSS